MQTTQCKLISLSIILLLFTNLNLLSQEESKSEQEKTPKSMIVGSVITNPPNRNYDDKSIGVGDFLHIYKDIGIELSFKVQYNTYDKFYCNIGAGIAYSF